MALPALAPPERRAGLSRHIFEYSGGKNVFGNACGAPANIKTQNLELAGCPANVKTQNLVLAGCPANTNTQNLELAGLPANTKTQNLGLAGRPANAQTAHSRLATPLQGIPIGKGAPFLHRIRVDLIAGICLGIESDTRLITIISAGHDFQPKSRGRKRMERRSNYVKSNFIPCGRPKRRAFRFIFAAR